MPNQPMEGVENPYLEGNFAPVTEEVTATDLQVEGELPTRAERSLSEEWA